MGPAHQAGPACAAGESTDRRLMMRAVFPMRVGFARWGCSCPYRQLRLHVRLQRPTVSIVPGGALMLQACSPPVLVKERSSGSSVP